MDLNERNWAKRQVLVILPLVVLAFFVTAARHFGYTPDDTYIYLQFAKNMVHGNGIAFNAGEPTYGFTGPLWLFLVAIGGAFGVDLVIAAKAMDLLLAGGAVILFYLAADEHFQNPINALLATIAFSVNIWFLRWAGSGMETSLSVMLVLAAFYFCMRNEYLLATITAAALALVRPEGALFGLLVAVDIVLNSKDRRRGTMLAGKYARVYLIIVGVWCVYAYRTFGTIIPNTALAKSHDGFGLASIGAGLWNMGSIVAASDGVVIAGLLVGGVSLWRQLRLREEDERFYFWRAALLGLGWAVLLPLVYLAGNVTVLSRYLLLATPFLTIFAYLHLFQAMRRSRYAHLSYAVMFLFTGMVVLQSQVVYRAVVRPGVEGFEEGMNTSLVSMGRWLKEHAEPDATILTWDIGAIGYYSDRRVCDAAGLVTPGLIPVVAQGLDLKEIVERKLYAPYCTVAYVVHRDDHPDALAGDGMIPLFARPFPRTGLLKTQPDYYTLYQVPGGNVQLKEVP
jgi:hypothetical protein